MFLNGCNKSVRNFPRYALAERRSVAFLLISCKRFWRSWSQSFNNFAQFAAAKEKRTANAYSISAWVTNSFGEDMTLAKVQIPEIQRPNQLLIKVKVSISMISVVTVVVYFFIVSKILTILNYSNRCNSHWILIILIIYFLNFY